MELRIQTEHNKKLCNLCVTSRARLHTAITLCSAVVFNTGISNIIRKHFVHNIFPRHVFLELPFPSFKAGLKRNVISIRLIP